jgi:hypothetical protein
MTETLTPETIVEDTTPSKPKRYQKDIETIDECFYVWETRFGLFQSETLEGRNMLLGATRQGVVEMTRWHLKCEQEGWPEGSVRVINSGVVDGKL